MDTPENQTTDQPAASASTEQIQLPHDRLINQTLQQIEAARVFVMSVNPAVGEEKMNELVSEFWPVQPEPGSVADQLVKKSEASGLTLGIAQERTTTPPFRMAFFDRQ